MLRITDVRQFYLGVQGENEEQTITIDVRSWLTSYPDGAISIYHKRNGESVPAPVATVFDEEAGTLSWTPTSTDTYNAGEGEAEIRLYENGIIKKSKTVKTQVSPSVTEAGGASLVSGWQGYISYVEMLKNGAISAKNAAEIYASITAHPPVIDPTSGKWKLWDPSEEEYIETGYQAIGKSFEISATYASIAAMEADYDNPNIKIGEWVIISAGMTDPDNGKVYQKGTEDWEFLVQMAGQKGDTGDTGTTFTPSVSAEGVISWTNDGGKENPTSRSIKGQKGDDGAPGEGVPEGGTAGQFLKKKSGTDFDTEWDDVPDPTGKADKVSGATSGNFAALDENGNLTDSGHKHSDYLTEHQDISGKADKVSSATSGNFAALDANGNLTDSGHKHSDYITSHQDISGKADKVSSATNNNFAALDANGNLKDSGHKHSDYLTQHQDISGKADKVSSATNNNFAALDSNGNLKDSGHKHSDYLTQHQDISGKADKVSSATSGNFAGLNSSGNLTDSGKAAGDFVSSNQGAGNAGKALGIANDGTVTPVPFSGEDFTGATSSAAGTHGYVPAPAAGQNVYYLKGDGTWAEPPSGKLIVVDLDTVTNTSGSYTHSTTLADITADMKAIKLELGDPSVFLDTITITTADGSITLSCGSVEGTSTVRVSLMFVAGADALTSSEFDILANRIGSLSSLTTTDKTNVVNAVNELNAHLESLAYDETWTELQTITSGSNGMWYGTLTIPQTAKQICVGFKTGMMRSEPINASLIDAASGWVTFGTYNIYTFTAEISSSGRSITGFSFAKIVAPTTYIANVSLTFYYR